MTKESKVTTATLVKVLIEKGFSVRKARKAVNGVFDVLARNLYFGENVPVPGGTLHVVPNNHQPRTEFHQFRDIHNMSSQRRRVSYNKQERSIKFTPKLKLEFESGNQKRTRLTPWEDWPALEEIRQLASEFLGYQVSNSELLQLEETVVYRWHRPDSLLNRLRELKPRVIPPMSLCVLRRWMWDLWRI